MDHHAVILTVPHPTEWHVPHRPAPLDPVRGHAPLRPPEQQPHPAALARLVAMPPLPPHAPATTTSPLLAAYYFTHTGRQP